MAEENNREEKSRKTLWNFIDSLEGDKVVWMIVLMLILISIVAIFSSTSQLAVQQGTTRMKIVSEQMIVSLMGLGIILFCYNIKKIGFFRIVSQFGYAVSMILLLMLMAHVNMGPIKALNLNHAWRIISFFGFQVNVFEVVKIAMIMYLAWAINAYRNDTFTIANILAKTNPFWGKPIVKKVIYIYIPMFSVCLGIMVGSLSSTVFIGAMMFITILIGGVSMRELLIPIAAACAILLGCVGINSVCTNKPFPHLDSALNRLHSGTEAKIETIKNSPRDSKEFQEALDDVKQPLSAKIAIHEGKFIGKGPGRSTQRYVVPIMFEDYMFSFIVEEYGLLGGIFVIMLYISLLARGAIIVKNCDNHFAKTAIAGLVLLITLQAMMHICINCDMGPLTGQTLPMVSHGNASFLMFSLAFGIILSISRMAKNKIARAEAKADPLVDRTVRTNDETRATLDDLDVMEDRMESGRIDEDIDFPQHENDIPDYGIDDHNNE